MSGTHLIYIPLFILMGIAIGLVIGRQVGVSNVSAADRRLTDRAARVDQLREDLQVQTKGDSASDTDE